MFPGGGTPQQINRWQIGEKKYKLAEYAISYGAKEIQLDYIRYNTKQPPSAQNAQNILKIIRWFKTRLDQQNIPLQLMYLVSPALENQTHRSKIKLFFSICRCHLPYGLPFTL